MWQPSILILTVVLTQIYAAPQFVTFKEGKLGVNFGGYHAAVGLGGLLGGNSGAEGGLFAEAGTPYGQAARAGLGGSVAGNGGGPSGGLYAGATAGGNVKAAAGLGGEITGDRSSGGGFASASSGGHYASSGLVGGTEIRKPTKEFEATYNKAYTDVKLDAINEIVPAVKSDIEAKFEVKAEAQPTVVVKEVYVEPPPPRVIEKTIIRTHKPHRHHLKKTVYIGGAIGGAIGAGADAAVAPPNLKTIQPIERRSDVGIEDEVYAGVGANVNVNANHGTTGEVSYAKKVTIQRNPTFFQDIFNIPIATLKAVNSFLTNTASGTSISVQKSASVQAGGYY